MDETVDTMLTVAPRPAQMAEIVAKAFYREVTKAGFNTAQIIHAASAYDCIRAPQKIRFL